MNADDDIAATITPCLQAHECEEDDCDTDDLLALVDPDDVDNSRVLCPNHRVAWLREVSEQ